MARKQSKRKSPSPTNGKPPTSPFGELPPGVAIVNVAIPVYTGEVSILRPDAVDKTSVRFLTPGQRAGVNRVFNAVTQMALRDGKPKPHAELSPVMTSRSEAARWVFTLIEHAAAEQLGIAGHAKPSFDEQGRLVFK